MVQFEKYTRFVDNKGRMFILLAKWAKIERTESEINLIPTTVDLLNVNEEKLVEDLTAAQFNEFIEKGQLRKII